MNNQIWTSASAGVHVGDGTNVTIVDNHIHTSAASIRIDSGRGHLVHHNVLRVDQQADAVIDLSAVYNTEISENVITCPPVDEFLVSGIDATSAQDSLIRNNRIRDCTVAGIKVGHRSLVHDNAVNGRLGITTGIVVEGDYNHIEGNLMTAHAWGLLLNGDGNIYRRNSVLMTGYNFMDNGSNNRSHGDNYMPGPM